MFRSSPFQTPPIAIPPPTFVQVEVSSRCNLKCRMCPLTLETTISSGDQGLVNEQVWNQMVAAGKLAGRLTIAGFGEPLTHPRFMQELRDLDDAGVTVSFSTNGIGFEKFAPELAKLKHLTHVNISIDSPDPEIYHEIRGGDVHRALSGARAIAQALKDHPANVTIAAVAMKSNLRSFMGFGEVMREMGIQHLLLQTLHDYTVEMDKEHLHTGRELELFRPTIRISEVLDELIADFQKSGVQLHPLQRVHMDSHEPWNSTRMYFHKPKEPHFTRACGIPFESLFVDQAGRVFPCCHSSGGPTLGQIGEQTFDEIWRGKKAQDFREALMDPARLPETCHHCSIVPWDEHPNRKYKAEITSCVYGDKGKIKLTVRNAGTVTWTQAQPLKLGCSRPRDRRSERELSSWSYHHRVAVMRDASVPPGGTTVLEFELGPAGKTEEYFELLLEGQTWLYGTVHSYK